MGINGRLTMHFWLTIITTLLGTITYSLPKRQALLSRWFGSFSHLAAYVSFVECNLKEMVIAKIHPLQKVGLFLNYKMPNKMPKHKSMRGELGGAVGRIIFSAQEKPPKTVDWWSRETNKRPEPKNIQGLFWIMIKVYHQMCLLPMLVCSFMFTYVHLFFLRTGWNNRFQFAIIGGPGKWMDSMCFTRLRFGGRDREAFASKFGLWKQGR